MQNFLLKRGWLITIAVLLSSFDLFAQSISVDDFKAFTKQHRVTSEKFLLKKGFDRIEVFKNNDNSIFSYKNGSERVYIGKTVPGDNGKELQQIMYMTTNKTYFLLLMEEIRGNFTYDKDEKRENDTIILLYNDEYKVKIDLDVREGEYSTIVLQEK